mmetsp:Transcript_88766/g.253716  ORF Transcript_88766/g.253716 Transcript_88766/m.253716 type:complete len:184 (+) Transcript_88766:841-1392(+)
MNFTLTSDSSFFFKTQQCRFWKKALMIMAHTEGSEALGLVVLRYRYGIGPTIAYASGQIQKRRGAVLVISTKTRNECERPSCSSGFSTRRWKTPGVRSFPLDLLSNGLMICEKGYATLELPGFGRAGSKIVTTNHPMFLDRFDIHLPVALKLLMLVNDLLLLVFGLDAHVLHVPSCLIIEHDA